ncbi:MAG: sn-glycerol-3-phosphate ABC transporter permease UgpA [Trueperaceae bacterium]|nr:sn-glycerol-3-phosphate ABC transporter permease UgpA [Trueperaceae bacterium]
MQRRTIFRNRLLPYLLLAPQLAITIVFFFYPAGQALYQSMLLEDPFGTRSYFVWFENFQIVLGNPLYYQAMRVTVVFSLAVTIAAMVPALLLAVMADQVVRGASGYRTLMVWPYAVAPAVAAALWVFIFHPNIGQLGQGLNALGIRWDYRLDGDQALLLVIFISAWRQVSYNFLFFLAGLQSIPKTIVEAAAIDGASPTRRFWMVVFPLLSPTTFFLLIINILYSFFDTFGVIHAITQGGPGRATTTLMYRLYRDGWIGGDLGGSAAQSVILMTAVILLTAVQFRYIERRVHY